MSNFVHVDYIVRLLWDNHIIIDFKILNYLKHYKTRTWLVNIVDIERARRVLLGVRANMLYLMYKSRGIATF